MKESTLHLVLKLRGGGGSQIRVKDNDSKNCYSSLLDPTQPISKSIFEKLIKDTEYKLGDLRVFHKGILVKDLVVPLLNFKYEKDTVVFTFRRFNYKNVVFT